MNRRHIFTYQSVKRDKEMLSNSVIFFDASFDGLVLYGCTQAFENNIVCYMVVNIILIENSKSH